MSLEQVREKRKQGIQQVEGCLVGTLQSWPLHEVLSWLHQTQRTAMVRVGVGLDAGVIFFYRGQLFRCEWRGAFGENALLALMGLQSRAFTILQREVPTPVGNIRTPTPELLLQCTVALSHTTIAGMPVSGGDN